VRVNFGVIDQGSSTFISFLLPFSFSFLIFFYDVFKRYAQTTTQRSHADLCCNRTAIREFDAKLLLAYWLERAPPVAPHAQVKTKFVYPAVKVAQIAWDPETDSITPDTKLPGWVFNTQLVAKPDQLIKRRGKAGLLALNKTWDEAKPWIAQRAGKPQKVGLVTSVPPLPTIHVLRYWQNGYLSIGAIIFNDQAVYPFPQGKVPAHPEDDTRRNYYTRDLLIFFWQVESITGTLNNFIVEPFLPHPSNTEYYVCITSAREGDSILFTHEGGVDIGDVDAKALILNLPVTEPFPSRETIASTLLTHVPAEKKDTLVDFLIRLYSVYVDLHFAYLEINPLVVLDAVAGGEPQVCYLDMAAKLDQTAESICGPKWAIARDLSVYERNEDDASKVASSKGGKVSADRGPPMVWPASSLDCNGSTCF
jgi:hypothetical protein